MTTLRIYNKQLSELLARLKERFLTHEPPSDKHDRAFFELVKAETGPMYELLQKWHQTAADFVQQRDVSVHPQQVQSTEENVHLIILHSYYIDIRSERYMDYHQSIGYVIHLLDEDLDRLNGNDREEEEHDERRTD
ncbi:protein of unknown function [Terribacillus halophilus]|uniref:Uncharacterized protein n=1 Tax=Terribacillus halophilus TaxID=361279 RepID=A0A1G6V5K9_9BACI|nr:DUF1798 family protein [Terribacillus halophilus]SDD48818.1 protein of unknown function [Terribacillus halophilus]